MTLDTLINKLEEAREHCVPGNSSVNVYSCDGTCLPSKARFKGKAVCVDYNNRGVNLYFYNL